MNPPGRDNAPGTDQGRRRRMTAGTRRIPGGGPGFSHTVDTSSTALNSNSRVESSSRPVGYLTAAARLIVEFGATITEWPVDDLPGHALDYTAAGWAILPCDGKRPRTRNGVHDASTVFEQVVDWWARSPNANIGGRVPEGVCVVDIDPRNGGDETWAALTAVHTDLATRTVHTGRGDGGRHLYFRRPGGPLNTTLGDGVDVKAAGYCLLPPSIHPDTGGRYRWADAAAPIVTPPDWLARLLRRTISAKAATARPADTYTGDSIAEWFTAAHTWADVLGPHGWALRAGDGDSDGSAWRHPTATADTSATIKHECLFVYSTSTTFEPTTAGDTHGYTRFRAWALLNHQGDMRSAARAARVLKGAS